jgi:dTDP-4-dehydrorhamnose reductase
MLNEFPQTPRDHEDGPTWVVLGASGLLGCNFVLEARKRASVWATFQKHPIEFSRCASFALDIRDAGSCSRLFEQARPDWVFNAAALTDVDYCEQHPDEAEEMNAIAAETVARAAREAGAGFVQVSTDSVFDGARGDYNEADSAGALNAYARSKLEGEGRVRTACPGALIIRANFFGWGIGAKPSYSEWLLAKLEAGTPFPVFSDVSFNPLLANTLAEMVLDLTEQPQRGIVHLGNQQPCTKLEFACHLARVFGIAATQSIRPTSVDAMGLAAARPHDTSLDTELGERLLGRPMPGLLEELALLRDSAPELRDELRKSTLGVREKTC